MQNHLEHLDHRHPPPCAVEDITRKFQSGSPDPIRAELFAAAWHEVRYNPYPFYERLRTLQPICPVFASSPFQVRWYVSHFTDGQPCPVTGAWDTHGESFLHRKML